MDDVYEVDNRYPEVFEPYEKIRGVRRHGGVENARRAARFDQIKRGFWTAAAATVTAVVLLVGSPGKSPQAAGPEPVIEIIATTPSETTEESGPPEPVTTVTAAPETEPASTEPFAAPLLTISAAELSGPENKTLRYSYQTELNSAEWIEVRAELSADNGETPGADGPFRHEVSETAPVRELRLTWTQRPASLTLTLTGTYLENGEEKTVTAAQTLEVPPYGAPSLNVLEAAINGAELTPLRCGYELTLNSAETLRVTAEVRADNGETLGTAGPFEHSASESVPALEIPLTWTTRPASLTLTLTGTYLENGEEKTVTTTRTLEVPPYTAPALRITEAELNGTDATAVSYRYRVDLNDAKDLRVTASVSSNTGAGLGTGGPYDHSASEDSPARRVDLRWSTRPSTVTLTLTGTYTENGTQKTVTATRTLNVPALPFTAPTLEITDASVYGIAVTPLSYSYRVNLNSVQELRVSATIRSGSDELLGSDGPYTHTASGSSPTRSAALSWTNRPSTVTLYLTGTYTQNGVQKTITVSRLLDVPPEVFDPPDLSIYTARVDDMDSSVLIYSFDVVLHQYSNPVSVTVSVVDGDGQSYGSAGPFDFTESGGRYSQTLRCSSSLDEDMFLVLTATYKMNGMPRTVTARKGLEEGSPFEWPELELMDVKFVPGSTSMLRYSYNVVMNSASLLRVKAQFYDESNVLIYETGYTEHGPDSDGDSVTVDTGVRPASMRLVGEFDHLGKTYTVYDSRDLTSLSVVWPNAGRLAGQSGPEPYETDR